MSDDEIRVLLLKGTTDPQTFAFLADLFEDYDPEEIPGILRHLARAAEAMRDKPADFDLMDLSIRELNALLGCEDLPELEIPNLTDRYPGFFDQPLRELDKRVGPHEARFHLLQLNEKRDAKASKLRNEADRVLATRFRFPD